MDLRGIARGHAIRTCIGLLMAQALTLEGLVAILTQFGVSVQIYSPYS